MTNSGRYGTNLRGLATLLAAVLIAGVLPAAAGAAAPTGAPQDLSPPFGTVVTRNPALRWAPVPGAVRHRVQVSQSRDFTTLLHNEDTYNTVATIRRDLPLGTIYWRVAGMDASYGVGPYSEASFQRVWDESPQLTEPADGVTLNYPAQPALFRWDALPGATSYRIQIDDAADFVGAIEDTTAATAYTLTDPQTVGQDFYWRVQGRTGTGPTEVVSAWSTPRTYRMAWNAKPTLTSPPNQTAPAIQDVVLTWEPVAGAATYHLQISPNGDWANDVIVEEKAVRGTRYSPPATLNNGHYYWRVRARDAKPVTPNEGTWSDEWQFTRNWPQRPVLLTPANGDTSVEQPRFSWTPIEHASHYQLEVSTDENFSSETLQICYTNQTEYTPYIRHTPISNNGEPGNCGRASLPTGTLSLNIGQRYYWRVRGIDLWEPPKLPVLGLWSNTSVSNTYTFIHQVPVPTLTYPDNGATVQTPVLKWNSVDGQGKYRVVVLKANYTPALPAVETYATSYTPTVRLNPADGPFKWYVTTKNNTGGEGLTPHESQWRTFSLATPDTVESPTLMTPPDQAPSARMPAMEWTPVTGADHYVVYIVAGGNVREPLSGTLKLPYAGYTHPAIDRSPGTYSWHVEARNALGNRVGISDSRSFVLTSLTQDEYSGPPTCSEGTPCTVGTTPTLTWKHVPLAGSYRVYVARDANFTNIIREYSTVFTSLTPRESYVDSQAGQSFYWFVRPCIDTDFTTFGPPGRCGPMNEDQYPKAYSFRKRSAAVKLLTPAANAAVENQATFTWEEYLDTNQSLETGAVDQGARKYRIQVSTVSDFASILDQEIVDQTTYTPFAKTYPEGPLYWRVQAIDGSNNNLTMSQSPEGAPGLLVKSSPQVEVLSPTAGTTVTGVPTLRWNPRTFAARYEVEVFKNGDTTYSPANRVALASKITKLAAWTPRISLPAGPYTWRVRRLDADGLPGTWTAVGIFTLEPAAVPLLQSPADGAHVTDGSLLLEWSASQAAAQYKVEVSKNSTFSSIFDSVNTAVPAWAPWRLYDDGTYYWRVHVLDSAGVSLAVSASRMFSKQTPMTTALTLVATPTTVIGAASTTLKGKLTRKDSGEPLKDRNVRLMGRPATSTSWVQLDTMATNFLGDVSFTHKPKRHWVYRLHYPTNGAVIGGYSASRLVKFQPTMAAALRYSSVPVGGSVAMNGAISPYFKGRDVLLQKKQSNGSWRTIARKTLGRPASISPPMTKFRFDVRPPKKGLHSYRVYFPAKTNVNLKVIGPDQVLNAT